jgi:cytochrome c-type biogenesis protein CcmH/NrfG
MLGRGRARAGDLEGAVRALRRALELRGDDPELLTDLAQLLALRRPDQSLQGEPRQLLERALRVDPDHPEALWLGGMAAAEAGEMGVTVERWERLLAQEDNVVQARELRRAMAAIRALENQGRDGEDAEAPGSPGRPSFRPPPAQEGS